MGEKWRIELAGELNGSPWAIDVGRLRALRGLLANPKATEETARLLLGGPARRPAVAILPILGVITQRAPWGANLTQLAKSLREALATDAVKAILLDVDSPGGTVAGVGEVAAEIRAARKRKPIVAVAQLGVSAAYWLASAASELVVTPSGEVGSIGVLAVHEDVSGALAKAGVKITLVSAGRHKAEGNPYEALADEARAHIQERVTEYYDAFVQAVALGRGVTVADVRAGYGQGRVVGARRALALGMADRIATVDEEVTRLARGGAQRSAGSAATVQEAAAAAALAELAGLERRRAALLAGDRSGV